MTGINLAQEGSLKLAQLLANLGYNGKIDYPDIVTKAKAREYIGLDELKLQKEKDVFKEDIIPQWSEQAKARKG